MNRSKLLIAAGGLVLSAASSGFAANGIQVRADVPFAFHAGALLLPPGNYVLTVNDPDNPLLVTIQDGRGKEYELLLTVPELRRHGPARSSELVFDRYGSENFLAQIWVAGLDEGRVVPENEVQRERAAIPRHTGAATVDVHGSSR